MLPVVHSILLHSLLRHCEWPCTESPSLLHVVLNHCASWPCGKKGKGLKTEKIQWPSIAIAIVCFESKIKSFTNREMRRCQKGNNNLTNCYRKVKSPIRSPHAAFPSWKYQKPQCATILSGIIRTLTLAQLFLFKAALATTWKGKFHSSFVFCRCLLDICWAVKFSSVWHRLQQNASISLLTAQADLLSSRKC